MNNQITGAATIASRARWQEVAAATAYPLSFILAVSAYMVAVGQGAPKWMSAYIPVIVCAVLVLPVLERLMPYRTDWRPGIREYLTDTLYVFLIQVVMPPLLGLVAVLALSEISRPSLQSSLWPHHWPLLAQGVLMVLLVDLMRYWVHRFAHTNPVLWRLHAVHHSPDKLYWLNTARFHPLEKVLHFLFDSMPFLLLGVNEYVFGFYFVCYSVNGFYQHCNVYLRFGPLSYLFSTAELHRWHHSKTIQEANHNYSNTTIVWDLLFGTYYRPRERVLARAGIENDHYPMGFSRQLLAPFIGGLEKHDMFVPSLREASLNLLLRIAFAKIRLVEWRSFERASKHVEETQREVLRGILQQNLNTDFGKRHQFSEITSVEQLRQLCTVQTYDSLRPYAEEQGQSGWPGLTAQNPVFYAKTSGTTGAAKLLPVTPGMLAQIKHQQALASYLQYQVCPRAFRGPLLGIVGSPDEGRHGDNGKPFGAISGLMYAVLPWAMRRKFIVPAAVFSIQDHLTKYLLILRLALAEKELTYLATANPATFVLLLDLAQKHWEELVAGMESGVWPAERELPHAVHRAIRGKLKRDPLRAAELKGLFSSGQHVALRDLWPYVELVATWTGGNCQIPLQRIRPQLPERAEIMDLGYMASECRTTLVMETQTSSGIPVFRDYFFEFVERDRRHEEPPPFLMLHQLQTGHEYYVFVTTTGGLYRYDMNDIVCVTGFWHAVPLIAFLQKGRGVTNITGEKLYESQVAQAMSELAVDKAVPSFLILFANRDAARYELYLEANGSAIDLDELGRNFDVCLGRKNAEYADKRGSGRLKPVLIRLLKPGTALLYRDYLLKNGQKDAQLKPPCLLYKDEAGFDFDSEVVAS